MNNDDHCILIYMCSFEYVILPIKVSLYGMGFINVTSLWQPC